MRTSLLVALALATSACGGGSNNNNDLGQSCNMAEPGGPCLPTPPGVATRTACGDVTEFCDPTGKPAPALACLATPAAPPPTPAMVTLTGFVRVFSSGPDSKGLSIAVYDAATLLGGTPLASATPLASIDNVMLDPTTQRACDLDAKNGCSIPSTTGCALPVCNDGLNGRPDNQKYCRDNKDGTFSCNQRLRWEARYTMPTMLPTNKQLAIRVTAQGGVPDQTWANVVTWNVYLSSAARPCNGDKSANNCLEGTTYQLNANALSKSDYVNIPVTAGLSGGITPGQGATAGEIHDCDDVRIENAVVSISPQPDRITFFNGNPITTVPDTSRTGTDRLGLYAGLNITPGPVKVVAGGTLDGTSLVSLGSFGAYIYPDVVSIININGGNPK